MAIQLTSVTFDVSGRLATYNNGVKASYANGGVTFTAKTVGVGGNNLRVVFEEGDDVGVSIAFDDTLLVVYDGAATRGEVVSAVTVLDTLFDATLTSGAGNFVPTLNGTLSGGEDILDAQDLRIDLSKTNKGAIGSDFGYAFFKEFPSGELDTSSGAGFVAKFSMKEWDSSEDVYVLPITNPDLELTVGVDGTTPAAIDYYETDLQRVYELNMSRTWTGALPILPTTIDDGRGFYNVDIVYIDAESEERVIFTSTALESSSFAEIIGSGLVANKLGVVLNENSDGLILEVCFKILINK